MNRDGGYILVSEIDVNDPALIERVRHDIEKTFGFQTVHKPLLKSIDFAFDPGRDQYHSTAILEHLDLAAPADALKVVALTQVDLFIPILTHVYGEAQLGGLACIVSTYRLRDGLARLDAENAFYDRIAKEVLHELGHTFQLRHCKDPSCTMHYCRTEKDVDRKSDQLCRYCRIMVDDEIKRMGGEI